MYVNMNSWRFQHCVFSFLFFSNSAYFFRSASGNRFRLFFGEYIFNWQLLTSFLRLYMLVSIQPKTTESLFYFYFPDHSYKINIRNISLVRSMCSIKIRRRKQMPLVIRSDFTLSDCKRTIMFPSFLVNARLCF